MKAILKKSTPIIFVLALAFGVSSCGGHHICATYVKNTEPTKDIKHLITEDEGINN